MLNLFLIKKVLQWLLISGLAGWAVQCNYSSDDDDYDYRVQLETLDTFQQNVSDFGLDEPIDLQLTLTNTGSNDLHFSFTSTQHHEFYVYSESDRRLVWQWSVAEDQMFLPAFSSHTVPVNGTWIESVTWDQTDNNGNPVDPGHYRIDGSFLGIATRSRSIHIH